MADLVDDPAVVEALRRQADLDAHDRSLIREHLAWSPEQRIEAEGPLRRD